MAKAFSLASWNVEHFKGDPARVDRIVEFLKTEGKDPDVFALYEVEGKEVYGSLVQKMPKYSFHITEGLQTQEILVGVKGNLTAFFTQKLEFKSGDSYLRPGALLSIEIQGVAYSMLFLHTKSGTEPKGLGLRDDMLRRACKFRKTLDKAQGGQWAARYIFLGDLNVMGMEYPFNRDIDAGTEIRNIEKLAKKVKMSRLVKTAPATWSNGSKSSVPDSDLDQVLATDNLSFRLFGGAPVAVKGWAELATSAERDKWIAQHSDHCMLYMEVQM